MFAALPNQKKFAVGAWMVGAIAVGLMSGCATTRPTTPPSAPIVSTALSPLAEPAAPRDAWRLAEAYAADNLGCEVVVGSGDSMLPLYRDRTVLVVRRTPISALRAGMTVVFTGDSGWPVAHALLERTRDGWRAIGVGNREPDRTLVRYDNLIGVVVKAYAPIIGFVAAAPDKIFAETFADD